jgi:hypothetical protein
MPLLTVADFVENCRLLLGDGFPSSCHALANIGRSIGRRNDDVVHVRDTLFRFRGTFMIV